MLDSYRSNWYPIRSVSHITGESVRNLRRRFASLPDALLRTNDSHRPGRPEMLYHFTVDPRLTAHHELAHNTATQPPRDRTPLQPDDLATAHLRLHAVREFKARARLMTRALAAAATCRDWASSPRVETVTIDERLPGGHLRRTRRDVSLGIFQPGTLRRWAALYRKRRELTALAPSRKGNVGRKREPIDSRLLDYVAVLASSSALADVTKAVARARSQWPDQFPDISIKTWQRRIRELDPERVGVTLGKRGIAAFRAKHSPDIDRDYSRLPFNGLWQLDDVTEDFYGHSLDPLKLVRPYCYAIIRVSTRQWVCAVASETPIVQDQVRSLVGFAFAGPDGGIPDELQFERGTIALDDYLAGLLDSLDVRYHRTSMDEGRVHPGALPDEPKGHAAGKGVIESNIARHHALQWDAPASTGPDERSTAHRNLEPLKALAIRRAKAGDPLILPTPAQWQARIYQALEAHNNKPHSGLPQIIDAQGKRRHLTPNERAASMADPVRVMDSILLPLFSQKGILVPVTKNGIRFNNLSYGRFEPDVQALAGQKVLAYGLKEAPDLIYVTELGRCVERFQAPAYGQEGDLIERKRAIERAKRNQHEALIARAMELPGTVTLDTVKFMRSPTPERPTCSVAPDPLVRRAEAIRAGLDSHRLRRARFDAGFDFDAERADAQPPHAPTHANRAAARRRSSSVLAGSDRRASLLDAPLTQQPEAAP